MIIECLKQHGENAGVQAGKICLVPENSLLLSGVSGFYDIFLYAGIPLFEQPEQGDRTWIRLLTR